MHSNAKELMINPFKLSRVALLEYVGSMDQVVGINRSHLVEGKAKGVEAIHLETGSGFSFTVLADRALDLTEASFCGKSLCWKSSAGIVAPSYYERKGSGWLRGFGGGMLVTCGIRNVGPASEEGWETYGLHGEISYSPATQVSTFSNWNASTYQMGVSGVVKEAYPFGPNLSLRRTWRTEMGANWVELDDVVTNEGFRPEIHMHLYHWNFGFPLVNSRSRLYLTTDTVVPRDEIAKRGLSKWNYLEPPTQDFAEQVFFHSFESQLPERTSALLISDEAEPSFGVELTYSPAQLPCLLEWKLCGKGEYVLGIEPGNCLVGGRDWFRRQQLPLLQPGETRRFQLRLSVLDTAAAIAAASEKYPARDNKSGWVT